MFPACFLRDLVTQLTTLFQLKHKQHFLKQSLITFYKHNLEFLILKKRKSGNSSASHISPASTLFLLAAVVPTPVLEKNHLYILSLISSPHSSSRDSVFLIYMLPHHPLFDIHHLCNPFPALTFVCTEHFEQFLVMCLDLQMDRYELSKCLLNKYTQ